VLAAARVGRCLRFSRWTFAFLVISFGVLITSGSALRWQVASFAIAEEKHRQIDGFEMMLLARKTPTKLDLLRGEPMRLPSELVASIRGDQTPFMAELDNSFVVHDTSARFGIPLPLLTVAESSSYASLRGRSCAVVGLPDDVTRLLDNGIVLEQALQCTRVDLPVELGAMLRKFVSPSVVISASLADKWVENWQLRATRMLFAKVEPTRQDRLESIRECCNVERFGFHADTSVTTKSRFYIWLASIVAGAVNAATLFWLQYKLVIADAVIRRIGGVSMSTIAKILVAENLLLLSLLLVSGLGCALMYGTGAGYFSTDDLFDFIAQTMVAAFKVGLGTCLLNSATLYLHISRRSLFLSLRGVA
jgi:hypothetical protein